MPFQNLVINQIVFYVLRTRMTHKNRPTSIVEMCLLEQSDSFGVCRSTKWRSNIVWKSCRLCWFTRSELGFQCIYPKQFSKKTTLSKKYKRGKNWNWAIVFLNFSQVLLFYIKLQIECNNKESFNEKLYRTHYQVRKI